MFTPSFTLTPLASAYGVGVGVTFLLLIEALRIRFKRRYHQIFIAAVSTFLLYLAATIFADSANNYLSFLYPPYTIQAVSSSLSIAFFYHFAMQFVSPKLSRFQKLTVIASYATTSFIIVEITLDVSSFVLYGSFLFNGYLFSYGFYLFVGYLFSAILLGLGYFLRYYFALESPLLKSEARLIVAGLLLFALGQLVGQLADLLSFPPPDWLTIPLGLGVVLIGLRKHGFPEVVPAAEEQSSSPPEYDLNRGISYLFLDAEPKRTFEVFDDLIEHGHFGLCITRILPETVRQEYAIKRAPIRWLSESRREDAVAPGDLVGLALALQSFLEKASRPVVLLHGLEYLISNNGFKPILRLLQQVGEVNAQKQGILLLPLIPGSLTERQHAMLKSECKPVERSELGLKGWLRGSKPRTA